MYTLSASVALMDAPEAQVTSARGSAEQLDVPFSSAAQALARKTSVCDPLKRNRQLPIFHAYKPLVTD